ncbi:MAG: SpoIVB peptidase S55 domain-containing protein, partial [Acidobacteriota bacterium]
PQRPAGGASTEIMPLSEIRAGMRGVGYTVVQGTEPQQFELEIIGVLENTFPNQSLVVARLSGLDLERSGIAAGMSGSPAYIDGRLIGAVSYRLGSFPTEPVAGITPIESMLRLGDAESSRSSVAARASGADMVAAAADLLAGRSTDLAPLRPASQAAGIAPIATPVSIGGVDAELVRRIAPLFEAMGWQPSLGGTSQNAALSGLLQPGSAVAAELMRGDVTFSATGTVTWTDGDRVLAFGHPFLQAGNVDFPMSAAEVLTVLPSLADSQKITAAGAEILGSIRQDRQAGVLGVLGTSPAMVPVSLSVTGDGVNEDFDFEMVAHKTLSPTFLFIGLGNALQSVAALSSDSAMGVSGELVLDAGYEPVRIENRFSSSAQAFFELAQNISDAYQQLYENPFRPVGVRAIDLDITVRDDLRVARISRVRADRPEVRPGESVKLSVWLEPYRSPEVRIDMELPLPEDLAPGPLSILIGDAGAVAAEERSFAGGELEPDSVEEVIRRLNRTRPRDRIYYQVARDDQGAFYGGRKMPSLPPSVIGLLSGGQTSGEAVRLNKKVLIESSEPVDYVVTGDHRIELTVRR